MREQRAFREMTEALRRVRNSRNEKSGARRRGHPASSENSSVFSDAEYEMVEDTDKKKRVDFLRVGNSRFPSSPKCTSLTRRATDGSCWNKKRHGVPSYRTQLRSAWNDEDLRDRDRGSKSFGNGRTVHFTKADTEWYAEQIAHSISGDAAELDVTWSFDPDESTWWCGVLDPSIPEPDVVDWSEDGSNYESLSCAEIVFAEQSQALSLGI